VRGRGYATGGGSEGDSVYSKRLMTRSLPKTQNTQNPRGEEGAGGGAEEGGGEGRGGGKGREGWVAWGGGGGSVGVGVWGRGGGGGGGEGCRGGGGVGKGRGGRGVGVRGKGGVGIHNKKGKKKERGPVGEQTRIFLENTLHKGVIGRG